MANVERSLIIDVNRSFWSTENLQTREGLEFPSEFDFHLLNVGYCPRHIPQLSTVVAIGSPCQASLEEEMQVERAFASTAEGLSFALASCTRRVIVHLLSYPGLGQWRARDNHDDYHTEEAEGNRESCRASPVVGSRNGDLSSTYALYNWNSTRLWLKEQS